MSSKQATSRIATFQRIPRPCYALLTRKEVSINAAKEEMACRVTKAPGGGGSAFSTYL